MATSAAELIKIPVDGTDGVTALWQTAARAKACFILAHGAGAGMRHPFLESFATQLATLRIASLRYQFLYIERGSKRPDPPKLCHTVVRAACAEARVTLVTGDTKVVDRGKADQMFITT